jgi:hypothetical protein
MRIYVMKNNLSWNIQSLRKEKVGLNFISVQKVYIPCCICAECIMPKRQISVRVTDFIFWNFSRVVNMLGSIADWRWDLAESWMRYSWVADEIYPGNGYPGWNLAKSWMRSRWVWMRFSKEWMRFSRVVDDIYLRHRLDLYEKRMRSRRLWVRSSWVVDEFSRDEYIPDEI